MAKEKFNLGDSLAAALGSVSDYDHDEQITYIPLQLLDDDANNFYSLDGLDELAANIELIGLQQPIRVRENPDMPGRYLITSGHRRRRAIWKLYEENPERWEKVACIVEKTAGSPQLQELRLIMANADTRKMSSADVAKQAERVQQLLYELKEQGYDFPGRMRDHVAEACKISSTKLAMLKVIREKLIPEWKGLYEESRISEIVAYKLAQLTPEVQHEIAELTIRPETITEWQVKEKAANIEKAAKRKCKFYGSACGYSKDLLRVMHLEAGYHSCFSYECCLSCPSFRDCKFVCPSLKGEQEAKRKKHREIRKEEIAKEKARDQHLVDRARLCWDRFHNLRTVAGLSVQDTLTGSGRSYCGKWHDDRYAKFEDPAEKLTPGVDLPFANVRADDVKAICKTADMLGCSVDYLLGQTDEKEPWQKTPWIACEEKDPPEGSFVFACTRDGAVIPSVYFRARFMDFTERSVANNEIKRVQYWLPLPAMPEGKKWIGQETIEKLTK